MTGSFVCKRSEITTKMYNIITETRNKADAALVNVQNAIKELAQRPAFNTRPADLQKEIQEKNQIIADLFVVLQKQLEFLDVDVPGIRRPRTTGREPTSAYTERIVRPRTTDTEPTSAYTERIVDDVISAYLDKLTVS
jgi:hypothetical protein